MLIICCLQVDVFTQVVNIPVAHADAGEHEYFNSLISKPEHHKSWSLRDQAQVNALTSDGNAATTWTFNPASDTYAYKQDALKMTKINNGNGKASVQQDDILHFKNLNLGVDPDSIIIIWDQYWGPEFRDNQGGVSHFKAIGIENNSHSWWTNMQSPGPALNSPEPYDVAALTDEFKTGTPLPNGLNLQERVSPSGAGTPSQYPNYQNAGRVYQTNWTRYILEIKPARPPGEFTEWNSTYGVTVQPNPNDEQGRWHMVSKWIIDENRNPQRLLYRVPLGFSTQDPIITSIRFTMDTSKIGFIGPWVGYFRNLIVLKDYDLPNADPESDTTIFVRPVNNSPSKGTVVTDTQAPTVTLTAPAAGSTVSGTATLTATAADNIAVAGVQFKLNGSNLSFEDQTSPYSISWNSSTVPNGTHTLTASARDNAGNTTISSSRTITTNNSTVTPPPPPVADTTAPTVSITAPAAGSTVTGTTTLTATASDNVGVVGVQFKLDGSNIGTEDTSSPYSVSWNSATASNGTHALTVSARDAAGNTTVSSSRTITINNTTVTPPPPVVNPPPPPPTSGGGGGSTRPTPPPVVKPTPVPSGSRNPRGKLVNYNGTIYFLGADIRYPFPSAAVFLSWGSRFEDVVPANSGDIAIPVGPVVEFKASTTVSRHSRGTLVNHNGTIYFLGAEIRYPFPSAAVFYSWGSRFENVVPANSGDISMPVGPIVEMKR